MYKFAGGHLSESDYVSPETDLDPELSHTYQIVRELGRGAFATVYLARERVLHRLVVIKSVAHRPRCE